MKSHGDVSDDRKKLRHLPLGRNLLDQRIPTVGCPIQIPQDHGRDGRDAPPRDAAEARAARDPEGQSSERALTVIPSLHQEQHAVHLVREDSIGGAADGQGNERNEGEVGDVITVSESVGMPGVQRTQHRILVYLESRRLE